MLIVVAEHADADDDDDPLSSGGSMGTGGAMSRGGPTINGIGRSGITVEQVAPPQLQVSSVR